MSEQALKQQAADNMDDECQASKPLHHRSVMRNNDEQNRQSEDGGEDSWRFEEGEKGNVTKQGWFVRLEQIVS